MHYVSAGSKDGTYPSVCRAAMITDVVRTEAGGEYVSLTVFNPEGFHIIHGRPYNEDKLPMTWHWPEREEEPLMQQVSEGLRSIDDARKELGHKPWGLPETS